MSWSSARLAALVMVVGGGCEFPQPADVLPPDAEVDAPACVPDTRQCSGSVLTSCDASGNATTQTCGFGCASSRDRCLDLQPSNALASYLDRSSTEPVVTLVGDATIDTSTGVVRDSAGIVTTLTDVVGGGPADVLVWPVGGLTVGNVAVTGTRALAIVANGSVVVNGILSVSAVLHVPGPGAITTDSPCAGALGPADVTAGTGGGGGGFGTAGGRGGSVAALNGGAGGSPSGDATLSPLRGGCRGGHAGSVRPKMYRQPGGGGGALQISTRAAIVLQPGAAITANGGGAKGLVAMSGGCINIPEQTYYCATGAGGGAGGGILLEAADVSVPVTAALTANGGAGHCSYLSAAPDGQISESPAVGTNCSNSSTGVAGNGAAGAFAATNGTGGPQEAAGGGGGAGRIRINLPGDGVFDPGPPIISPPPSLGTCGTR